MKLRQSCLIAMLIVSVVGIPLGAFGADEQKLDPRVRIALSQLRAGIPPEKMLETTAAAVDSAGELDVFIAGSVSRGDLEAAGAIVRSEVPGGIFTAFVPESAIDAVAALPGVERITGAVTCDEYLNASLPTTMINIQRTAGPAFTGASGAGVLIGDIDSGIAYKHGDFQNASGQTRIVNIWDQTDNVGPNPAGFSYGSEWSSADINALTARERDTNGHGTHVMGIAAGDGSATGGVIPAYTYVGVAPQADIIEIKSTYTTTQILDGAAYFFQKATARGQNAVLNISLGSQFGPHDGTSDFEAGLTALTGPGRMICVSAGNDQGVGYHAGVNVTSPSTAATFTVTGTGVNRLLAIDGYYEATEAMTMTVSGPLGSSGPVVLGGINAAYPGVPLGTGATKAYLYIENGAYLTSTNAREVYVELKGGSTTGSTINGTWTITFTPTAPAGAANGRVDLWRYYASTTALVVAFATGREEARLVSEPANAMGVISCAAWSTKNSWTDCGGRAVSYTAAPAFGSLASFSSNGPTRDGRIKPDIAAPGFGVGAARSIDITATCPASATAYLNDGMMHTINQGTSMAAPHVTGAVAVLMQKFGALTRTEILAKLAALALSDSYTGIVPNSAWGSGKMRVDVTDPNATVLYPNGGETLTIGLTEDLVWTSSDPVWSGVVSVDIQLSRNNGGTWEDLAVGVPNTGVHTWLPSFPATNLALLRVKAHDVVDNIGVDLSDGVFTLQEPSVAAEMPLFAAQPMDAGVQVSWTFADPSRYVSAWVERANEGSAGWVRLEAPVVTSPSGCSIMDATTQPGVTYSYRVLATDTRGDTVTFASISITATGTIAEFALKQIWPNPTKGHSTISFSVPRVAHIGVKVFDVRGRLVNTLVDASYSPGRYQTTWDGRTRDGQTAPNGVYFVHLVTPERQLVQRVTLVR